MTTQQFEKVLEQAKILREKKNHDYGNAFLASYNDARELHTTKGNASIYWDLKRKFDRLDSLLLSNKANLVADETVEDTLLDISIMCANAIVALRERKVKQ